MSATRTHAIARKATVDVDQKEFCRTVTHYQQYAALSMTYLFEPLKEPVTVTVDGVPAPFILEMVESDTRGLQTVLLAAADGRFEDVAGPSLTDASVFVVVEIFYPNAHPAPKQALYALPEGVEPRFADFR